jgi:hypothetical protein
MFAAASIKVVGSKAAGTSTRTCTRTRTRDLYKLLIAILVALCIGSLGYIQVFSAGTRSPQLSLNVATIECSAAAAAVTTTTAAAAGPIVLSRREQRGSWIGNTWIPPNGWKYYSVDELIDFYGKRSLLWIGDSTGWGASRTLFEILSGKTGSTFLASSKVVLPRKRLSAKYPCTAFGYTRDEHPESFCQAMPHNRGKQQQQQQQSDRHFLFSRINTLTELETFLLDEVSGKTTMTKNVDLIVVSLGIWEFMRPHDCKDRSGKNRTTNMLVNDTITLLEQFQSSKTIVWRTSGFALEDSLNVTMSMNEKAMDLIDSFSLALPRPRQQQSQISTNAVTNLTFIDWGGAMLTRSFGDDRIQGDFVPHYGVEARHAALQMITNQVAGMQERGTSRGAVYSR